MPHGTVDPQERERGKESHSLALEAGDAGRNDGDRTDARKAPAAVTRPAHRQPYTARDSHFGGGTHRARLGASLVKKAGVKPRTARPGLRGWMRGLVRFGET